jgi:hypothetical protein
MSWPPVVKMKCGAFFDFKFNLPTTFYNVETGRNGTGDMNWIGPTLAIHEYWPARATVVIIHHEIGLPIW